MPVEELSLRLPVNGFELAATAYRPASRPSSGDYRIAVIAHPWARLGGSMHDRVVLAMAYTLATASPPVAVITFNARGFGGSSGGASWWGCEAEQRDYEGVVRWAVARAAWLSGEEEDQQGDVADQVEVPAKRVEMICCGYSHGSLLAPFTPSLEHRSDDALNHITYRYILISPPLGVAWFLSPFGWGSYDRRIRRILQIATLSDREDSCTVTPADDHEPAKVSTLLIVSGGQDQFTSHAKYQAWAGALSIFERGVAGGEEQEGARPPRWVDIEAADHFWSSRVTMDELVRAVQKWL